MTTTTPRRVLVVDDAATVRRYHGSVLRGAGWHVDEAANGYEALERALVQVYDLFVVDINMPRLDGYGLVRHLRSEAASSSAPVIMISTEARAGDVERAYAAGANLYLVKPVGADELVITAEVLVGTRHASRGVPV